MVINFFNFMCLFLFFIGFFGVFYAKQNLLIILMSMEIMLLSVNLNFIFTSILFKLFDGQIYALFLLGIAGVESIIGLAIFIIYYKVHNHVLIGRSY